MHPYLALETVKQWHGQARTQSMMEAGKLKDATLDEAQANYRTAVENGGAQIFKAMGLGEEAVNTSFKGTTSTSRIGGVDLSDIGARRRQASQLRVLQAHTLAGRVSRQLCRSRQALAR